MLIDFFIKRPIFAIVCSLLIMLGGLIAIPTLAVSLYPQITPPSVTVVSRYIGASAQVVESAVTTPLEQEINGVKGMKYITSTSSNDGTSNIQVTFDLGTNLDDAAVEVQNRVNTAMGRLPQEIKNTGVSISKESSIIMAAGIYSKDGRYTNAFLSNYADRYIKDALRRVKGVGGVEIFGERKYAMRLWLDPVKLAARHLTAADVVRALQEQNAQVAAGQVGQPPVPNGQRYQMTVNVAGRLKDEEAFNNLVISSRNGVLLKLQDIGRAELGAEDYGTILRFNGYEAVGIGVSQLPDANALDVSTGVYKEMQRLKKSFPPGLDYLVAFDSTQIVGQAIEQVIHTLVEAIILVVLVIFVFLQNWRTTLIPAITIPVSLIGTFIFVKLFGFSLNTLTMFGITLATGLVVDDAIVVIENIARYVHEKGMSPMQAAKAGMDEIAGAVVATSLVLIAVFVPVAFFPGTTGQLYKQFALTIAFSIAISMFCAFTLTPTLSARLLQAEPERKHWFFRVFDSALDTLKSAYQRSLMWALKAKAFVVLGFLMALTAFLLYKVPSAFIPGEDQGYFVIAVQAPAGASLEYTTEVVKQVETQLKKFPDIIGMFAVTGFSFSGRASNKAMIFPALKPIEERHGAAHSLRSVVNQIRGPLMSIPEALVIPFEPPTIQGVGTFGGVQFEVLDQRGADDFDTLSNSNMGLVMAANQSKALAGVFSSFTANDPILSILVNRDEAKRLNVPLSEIFSTMQIYLGSVYVNDFDMLNRIYRVYVQAEGMFRANPEQINEFYVRSDDEAMVPLGNLVNIERKVSPQVINHYNLFRSTEISASPKPGYSTGQAIAEMETLAKKVLPQGFAYEWSGLSLEQIESGGKTLIIFALGIVVVFLVLAAQYESLMDPLIIMFAVPLAILGALAAQMLRGLENDVFCQIGLVMLVGLASKNAILIVEFANHLRAQGRALQEAVVEAASIRLRPILMTSLAFILGILPLVLAQGAGSASRQSLGTAVFGGMIVSTVLSLFIVPVLYVLLNQWRDRFFKRQSV